MRDDRGHPALAFLALILLVLMCLITGLVVREQIERKAQAVQEVGR